MVDRDKTRLGSKFENPFEEIVISQFLENPKKVITMLDRIANERKWLSRLSVAFVLSLLAKAKFAPPMETLKRLAEDKERTVADMAKTTLDRTTC